MNMHEDLNGHSPRRRSRRPRRVGVVGGALALAALGAAVLASQAVADDAVPDETRASLPTPAAGAVADEPHGQGHQTDSKAGNASGIEVLQTTLARVAPAGIVSDPEGMNHAPNRDGSPNAWGHLDFAPSSGEAAGGIGLDYWPVRPADVQTHSQCNGLIAGCETSTLPDGSVVVSYVVPANDLLPELDTGPSVAAHRIVGDTVVTIMAQAPGSGADPVLTEEELVELISQPEWALLQPA